MKPPFREDKATQAAAILLKLHGGKMSYMKLIKLLYIVDRQALISWGRPVTYDSYVSMDRGPVLSKTYDLINDGVEPGHESYWDTYISEPEHRAVELLKAAPDDELSESEVELIHKVFSEYGNKDRWELVDITHQFSEWQDPEGSAIPISYHDILKAVGKTENEVATIIEELESLALFDHALS